MYNKIRDKLIESVRRNKADGILFSGGLDTSILAALQPEAVMINVCLENYAPDLKFAKMLQEFLGLKVYYLTIKTDEAISVIPKIVKIIKSFDPAIPNDIPVYFGLKFAKQLGLKTVTTGDGADELFAGYRYMRIITHLSKYIKDIARNMYFTSNEIGKYFGLKIKQPYLDKEFRDFSLVIPTNLKIKKIHRKLIGKWILRKAFENVLPEKIIWQNKRPLEYGSGMTKLREIISSKITDDEFTQMSKFLSVKFINKEHFYYYKIYKDIVGKIPKPIENQKACPCCGAGMNQSSSHCRTCGYISASDFQ
ncbi:MAG: asparagine synthase-related protein [Elusimicrobiota bacterium]